MFDVGFWEIIFISVIALLVIGPERLPRVARTLGLWVGKARGFYQSVKADIDRELEADELRRSLERQMEIPELNRDILDDDRREQDKQDEYAVKAVSAQEDEPRRAEGAGDEAPEPAQGEDAEARDGAAKPSPSDDADGQAKEGRS